MRGRSCTLTLVESGSSIDTHRLAGISLTVFKRARVVVPWHVPTTTHDVVNVLAQLGSPRTFFTSSEAEDSRRHEVRPFMQLLQLAAVKRAGEDQAADGISIASGTVGIQFTTRITGGDIH